MVLYSIVLMIQHRMASSECFDPALIQMWNRTFQTHNPSNSDPNYIKIYDGFPISYNHLILLFTVSMIYPISPGCILSYILRVSASFSSSLVSTSLTTYSAGSQQPYRQHRQLVPLRLPSNNLDFS